MSLVQFMDFVSRGVMGPGDFLIVTLADLKTQTLKTGGSSVYRPSNVRSKAAAYRLHVV